jgi:hypothetical protein
VEEVTGVSLDHTAHLVSPERGDGAPRLALATVLPPGPEGGQAQLDGVLVGVGAEPRGEDGLDEGVGKAGAGEGLVWVVATVSVDGGHVVAGVIVPISVADLPPSYLI